MQVISGISRLKRALKNKSSVGFVPTMGALHDGHLSLIETAKKQTDFLVVSIFVNPTQFDNKEDLDNYPSTLQEDLEKLRKQKCDIVFTPSIKEMYATDIKAIHFDFKGLDQVMEGAKRKGHFDGVGTIVKRFFDIIHPDFSFFGEKDFQQLQLIKKMVVLSNMKVKIVAVPIHRENDGLAMSSRNVRLTNQHRDAAPFIYKTLKKAKLLFGTKNANTVVEWVSKEFENHPLLSLEYFSIAEEESLLPINTKIPNQNYRAFIAVYAGKIRLIDNIAL